MVDETIEASIEGGSSVTTTNGGNVSLTATDSAAIDADAGGVAIAVAAGKGGQTTGSVSIGAAVASNTETDTDKAYIDGSSVTAAGSISVKAQSVAPTGSTAPYRIDALAFGIAGSASATGSGSGTTGALAGAGSGAYNTVDNTVAAYIKDCTSNYSVNANGGGLSLTASDDTSVRADSGGYAVAIAASQGGSGIQGAGAIGASESINAIGQGNGDSVKAYIDNSTVTAAGNVTIGATSTVAIDALAIGGAGAGSGTGGSGLSGSLAGAGAGTINALTQTIEASIKGGSSVTTTNSGNVSLTATDSSSLKDDAGGVAIAIAANKGSGIAGSGSIGAAVARNNETDTVNADIDGSSVTAAGSISVKAQSVAPTDWTAPYRIDALAFGVALSGAGSSSGAFNVALSGAGSGAYNTIDNTIAAYIQDCTGNYSVHANGGGHSLNASDDNSVRADSGGYAIAIAASAEGRFNGGAAIGASESNNAVGQGSGDSVEAYIDNSTVTAASNVTIKATTTVKIDASAIGGSLSAAGSGDTGLSGALAGAGAGTVNTLTQKIEAYIADDSSVTTTNLGNICLTATDGSRIAADAGGVAIAIAVGKGGQGDLTIGASVAANTVANTVHADISGSFVDAAGNVTATAQSQAATDQTLTFQPSDVNTSNNQITLSDHDLNTGDRVIYHSGGGAAIGGLVDGQSYYAIVIDGDTIELAATKGEALESTPVPITLTSTGTGTGQSFTTLVPTIDAEAIGGAGSGAGGQGLTLTFAGAGAGASNTVNNDIEAYITGCSPTTTQPTWGVTAGGAVSLTAIDDSVIHAETGGVAIAISGVTSGLAGALSVGASDSVNQIGNVGQFVKAYIDSSTVSAPGNVSLSSLGESEIDASAIGGAGSGAGSSGIALAGAIAGAVTTNTINESILSAIQNGSDVSTMAGFGGNINLSSTDASSITGDAGGVAIAIALGTAGGGGVSVGFAQATNTIGNTTTSDIDKSQVTADGSVSITATSLASINALSYGGSGSVGGGADAGVALAGAGAGASNERQRQHLRLHHQFRDHGRKRGHGDDRQCGALGHRRPIDLLHGPWRERGHRGRGRFRGQSDDCRGPVVQHDPGRR